MIKIITDSGSDLSISLQKQYNIHVIPLRVYDEHDHEFLDGVTIQPSDVLHGMKEGQTFKTSLPLYEHIHSVFEEAAKNEVPCLYLTFSSELSGTYQSAVMICNEVREQYPHAQLEVIDTKCASLGQGLLVLHIAKLEGQGASMEELIEETKKMTERMEHIITVDDLEYLVRGGRVSRVAGFMGGLLNIKPVIHMKDGKLIPIEKVRGMKKTLRRIVEIAEERGECLSEQTIGIVHGDNEEAAFMIKDALMERFGCEHFYIETIGSAIGAHTGPGMVAVFFQNKKE